MKSRNTNEEAGFFTIWTLGLCVCVLILGGLFVDLWHAFDERRQVANMVDAAAVAGGSQVDVATFADFGVVQLDESAAVATALTFFDEARVQNELDPTRVSRTAYVDGDGRVVVIANYELDLQFTGVFVETEDLNIEVTGRAKPLRASPTEILDAP